MKASLSILFAAFALGSLIEASGELGEAVAPPVAADEVVRIYDISALVDQSYSAEGLEHLFLPSPGGKPLRTDESPGLNRDDFDCYAHEFVERVLGDELYYEGRFVGALEGQRLIVRGPAALQVRVQELLAFLDSFFNASTQLQIDLVRLEAGVAPKLAGILSPEEADALIARAGARGEHQRYQLQMRSDRPSSLRMVRDVPIVFSHSVEIAQGSMVWNSLVAHAKLGTRLWARAVPDTDGLLLALSVMQSEAPMGVRDVPIHCGGLLTLESEVRKMRGPELIQNLSIFNRSITSNVFLPSNKVVALSGLMNLNRGQRNDVILIRQGAGQLPLMHSLSLNKGGAQMHLVDAQRFTPPQAICMGELFSNDASRADMTMPWDGYDHPVMLASNLVEPEEAFPSELLETVLQDSEPVEIGARLALFHVQGAMVDAGNGLHRGEVVAGLLEGMPSASDQVQIRLRAWRKGQRQAVAEMNLPVRMGSSACGVLGIEDFEVESQYVEIARDSTLSDPTTSTIFDGVAFMLAPRRTPNGGIEVDVRGAIHVQGEQREASLGYSVTESLHQTDHEALFVDESVYFSQGSSGEVRIIGQAEGGMRIEISLN